MPAKKSASAVVDGKFSLIKYPGKGGWTYVAIPPFGESKKTRFAYHKIDLVIDGHTYNNASIWKMKDGNYFLPVKSEIRKKIGKQDGDSVHIQLFKVPEVLEDPDEILLCLKEERQALKRWKALSVEERKEFTEWIMNAPREQTKIDRLAKLIDDLLRQGKPRKTNTDSTY